MSSCSMNQSVVLCCFLTSIHISQEAGQVVWYSYLLKNFPQFIVIHTVTQSCPTLWGPTDCSLPDSSLHGILQAGILEWVAMPSFRGSSQTRGWTQVSGIADRFFTIWDTTSQSVSSVAHSFPILCNTMDFSTPNFPVHYWERLKAGWEGDYRGGATREAHYTTCLYMIGLMRGAGDFYHVLPLHCKSINISPCYLLWTPFNKSMTHDLLLLLFYLWQIALYVSVVRIHHWILGSLT